MGQDQTTLEDLSVAPLFVTIAKTLGRQQSKVMGPKPLLIMSRESKLATCVDSQATWQECPKKSYGHMSNLRCLEPSTGLLLTGSR